MKTIPTYVKTVTAKPTQSVCRVTLLCALLAALAAAPAQAADAAAGKPAGREAKNDISGTYTLTTVDGKKVPTKVAHENATLEVRAGTFTITADGKCISKMTFVPPSGKEVTLERKATYTRDGQRLDMQWEGAGRTTGTVQGKVFTMNNEGMVFAYKK